MTEHLAVSQFPSGRPTQRGDFPLRNRTMALFADVTVIIEAGEKSGTIHQGWESRALLMKQLPWSASRLPFTAWSGDDLES